MALYNLYSTHCDKIAISIYLDSHISIYMILKNSVLFQIAVQYNTLHYFLEPVQSTLVFLCVHQYRMLLCIVSTAPMMSTFQILPE